MAGTLFSKATLARFVETFVVVFLTSFSGSALFGVSFNITTHEGQAALAGAAGAAVILALRRAVAAATNGSGPAAPPFGQAPS
jgi:hypothetical protein